MPIDNNIKIALDKGDYEKAYQLIVNQSEANQFDEETLYLIGLTAPSGKKSALSLKEYLQRYPRGRYGQKAKMQLLDYYSASGLNITANKMYSDAPLDNLADPSSLYEIALCKQRVGEYSAAKSVYNMLAKKTNNPYSNWARLGIADCDFLLDNYDSAIEAYESLLDKSDGLPQTPFILIGLAEAYNRKGQFRKAETLYTLYKNDFNSSPRLDELEAQLLENNTERPAEKLNSKLDIGYYIQVGVFSKKDNAKICFRKFRQKGLKAQMEEYKQGNQTYFKVFLGPFKDEASAKDKKTQLEKSEGEDYILFIK